MTWNEMIALLESGAEYEGTDADNEYNYIAQYDEGKYIIIECARWSTVFETYIPTEMIRHMTAIEPLDQWTKS